MTALTVAERIARSLREEGVDLAFGLPGGEVVELVDALRREGIRFILTKHETSAAFAAQTYGLLQGVPGVAITTLGPGATNAVTGVANAYLDRAPLLYISANLRHDRQALATHQRLDLQALYAPVTKWRAVLTPGQVQRQVRHAVRVAVAEHPGPVYLELASDLAGRPEEAPAPSVAPVRTTASRRHAAVTYDAAALDELAERVRAASRPAVIAGFTALRSALSRPEVPSLLARLGDLLAAPLLVTPKAKGVVAEDGPRFLGVLEGIGTRHLFEVLAQADLIVAVGADASELDRWWDFVAPVIALGPEADDDDAVPQEVRLEGPVAGALRALVERLQAPASGGPTPAAVAAAESPDPFPRDPGAVAAWRGRWLGFAGQAGDAPPAAHEVVAALRRGAPRDACCVTDVGLHKLVAAQCWTARAPGRYFLSNGLSSMGYGVPAAMAVKLARPQVPVLALVGDGGLAMTLGELETLRREGVAVVVAVLADASLMLIRQGQERRGYPAAGVDFANPDFLGLAGAFGLPAFRAETAAGCGPALTEALEAAERGRCPAVLEIPIARRAY